MLKTVHCPHCKKEVVWSDESPFRPFCSKRCRLIDLGSWADGSYTIPTTERPEEGSDSSTDSSANDLSNPDNPSRNSPEDQ